MKKIILAILGLVVTLGLQAQSTANNDLEIIQSIFGKEKQQLIDQYLELPDDVATKFWPIYETYEMERRDLATKKLYNLAAYIDNYETLTDDMANTIAKESLKLSKEGEKLHKKYYNKLKKAIGVKYAVQFMQIEIYIEKMVSLEVMDNIPFIGEMEDLVQ